MNTPTGPGSCPSCGHKELCHGAVQGEYPVRFLPSGNWFTGYYVRTFVCLGCGYLGNYLSPEDVSSIKATEQQ